MNEPCEECHGTGTRERVWDSAPCVCCFCDGTGWLVGGSGSTVIEVEADREYNPIVVTRIIDKRHTAEAHAAWARFRARVAAMGVGVPEVE